MRIDGKENRSKKNNDIRVQKQNGGLYPVLHDGIVTKEQASSEPPESAYTEDLVFGTILTIVVVPRQRPISLYTGLRSVRTRTPTLDEKKLA